MDAVQNADLKRRLVAFIDERRASFIELGRAFYRTPELAYREEETAALVEAEMKKTGAAVRRLAHTGVDAVLDSGRPGPRFGVIAEIDALYLPTHPDADPESGAAHVCGHHMQTAALCGVARALSASGVLGELRGSVSFHACPAEEGNVPDALFERLEREVGLTSKSGKQAMLDAGSFDRVEGILSTHALINDEKVTEPALLSAGCNGFNTWTFTLRGKAAHPTMDPSKGVDAQNAAQLALFALKCVQEALPLDDYSLILASLTDLSIVPESIPEKAVLQVITKSRTPSVLKQIDDNVVRAVRGAAAALGCGLEADFEKGYDSYVADAFLSRVYRNNAATLLGRAVNVRPHGYYSNDLGNVSQVVPVSQIVVGGFSGALHSERFQIDDEAMAYVMPSKMIACTLIDLLS